MIFSCLLDALIYGTMQTIQLCRLYNYADYTTVFACQPTLDTVIRYLETDSTQVAKWFSDNYLKLDDDKCHLMIFGDKCSKATVTIRNLTTNESEYEILLGITFEKKVCSIKHVEDLCKKVYQKLHAFAYMSAYIALIKLKILINFFIKSQFNYCLLE